MLSADDAELRELLGDYAALQAEHQRLLATPDDAGQAAHEAKLQAHLIRAQLVIERLERKLKHEPSSASRKDDAASR
jgi:hypothetical protein